jgi:PKD repeat protein
LVCALALAVVAWACVAPRAASAAPGDIGYEGPSTVGAQTSLTGEKPESKLWWNDGFWWASMWSGSGHRIHRLDTSSQSWVNTGVPIDNRGSSRADVLWDGGTDKLYVASHVFSNSSSSGYPARLYRYSYDAGSNTYSLDSGFPVTIANYRTEALVIAKDSTGQLWATWKQGTKIVVASTVCNPGCNDANWGPAFSPSVPGTTISSDDISSITAFGGDKIGLFWSNQNADADYFAVHSDSDPDTAWSGETALSGPNLADDHVNLKTDSGGRVYAAVKTSASSSTAPLVYLLVRSTTGTWSRFTFGLERDHHTRPIVVLDEAQGTVHVFATSPESGGSIYQKSSPIGSISFPGGKGTEVLKDADGTLNNVTSTKQNVSEATGLVILAAGGKRVYFHQYFPLTGGGGQAPTAAFSGSPTSGAAPLTVQFTDASTGEPTSWEWDFQNDGTVDSTQRSPSFTYASPGTYSVELTVGNGSGSDTLTKANYITVSPGGGQTLTFAPSDDAFVRSNHPDENNGSLDTLRTWKGEGQTNSFLKFDVSGVAGTIASAKLRLYVVDGSSNAGNVYPVDDDSWTEGGITWTMSPPIGSTEIGRGGAATLGTWLEIDLGSAIGGNGTVSLAVVGASSNAAWFSSSEGSNSPQLVLTQS